MTGPKNGRTTHRRIQAMAKMTPSCRNESTAFSSALTDKGSFSSAPDGAGVGLRGRSCVHSFGGGGGGRRGADARDGAAASSRRRRPALSMGAKWSVAPIRATVATRAKATRPRTMEAEHRPPGGGRMAAHGRAFLGPFDDQSAVSFSFATSIGECRDRPRASNPMITQSAPSTCSTTSATTRSIRSSRSFCSSTRKNPAFLFSS